GLAEEVLVEPGHDAEQRGLAGAVRPQDADLGARKEGEVDPSEDLALGRDDLAQVPHGEDVLRRHRAPYDTRRARRIPAREEEAVSDRRVQFDFDVQFSNGGSLQGRGFRLDIEGDDVSEAALADHLVRDLRLLMVGAVRIRNKSIVVEPT